MSCGEGFMKKKTKIVIILTSVVMLSAVLILFILNQEQKKTPVLKQTSGYWRLYKDKVPKIVLFDFEKQNCQIILLRKTPSIETTISPSLP